MTTYRLLVYSQPAMDRKQHILDTFLDIGSKKGFQSVSLSDIAEAEKINKASIFSHFSNYDDLKKQAKEYCLGILNTQNVQVDFSSESAERLFVDLINSFIEMFSNKALYCFLRMVNELKYTVEEYSETASSISKMITARLTVALDYCVQRSWSNIDNTDELACILTPYIMSLLLEDISDDELSLQIKTIVALI